MKITYHNPFKCHFYYVLDHNLATIGNKAWRMFKLLYFLLIGTG